MTGVRGDSADSGGRVSPSRRSTLAQPFEFAASKAAAHAQRPLLYVDLQLPNGRKGKVGIYEGDRAEAVARNFALTYQLCQEMRQQVQDIIAHHIETMMPLLAMQRDALCCDSCCRCACHSK